MKIAKPAEQETNDFFRKYIDLVKHTDLLSALHENQESLTQLFSGIPSEIEVFRYDTNKWSIKEVLMHLIDFERYLTFKAFVSMRNDNETALNHPNREHYLFHAHTEKRSLNDLIPEFLSVRSATISLFQHTDLSQLTHTGNPINPNHAISGRAMGFALTGHSIHHMSIISERYLRLSNRSYEL
ncbi:DinB family protein [Flavitalea sp.]|nr:DinB family protein [Flavitalea sp.]